jgi:hypothetical protein
MKVAKPILHGRDHACGGADPIPGICDVFPAGGDITDKILASNPDAFWKLDETSGTVAQDSSGNGHDLSSAGYIPPTWGQAAGPPGTTSAQWNVNNTRLAGPAAPMVGYTDNFTCGLWVNVHDPVQLGELIGQDMAMHGSTGWALMVSNIDTTTATFAFAVNSTLFDADAPFVLDRWYLLALVRDSGTWKLYIDGLLQAATSTTSPGPVDGTNTWIGKDGYSGESTYLKALLSYAFIINRPLTSTELVDFTQSATHNPGDVITTDPNGNPVWAPPTVGVTTNGSPATTPEPTPDPPGSLSDPPTYWGATTDWINDQPFTYGGTTFTAQPNTWTTIPFTTPSMQRQSNVTAVGTLFQQIAWNSPDAAGWINPSDPHAIVVPHDMPLNEGAGSTHGVWFQICLRLDVPAVELTTSRRALRVFETTHQKPVVQINTWRNTIDMGGGSFDVITQTSPTTDDIFANGNPGGTTVDIHKDIAFAPNDMTATSIFDWLPVDSAGNKILKKGMRLVAQVWHNAGQPVTFNAGGVYTTVHVSNYRPHFLVFASMDRAWGPPWSTWPPP